MVNNNFIHFFIASPYLFLVTDMEPLESYCSIQAGEMRICVLNANNDISTMNIHRILQVHE